MNVEEFWDLIDNTRKNSFGDPIRQAELLTNSLVSMSESDILDYYEILRDIMDDAYIGELLDVAYILGCGCGDDGFMDFRAWLISRGKATFERALQDPESLGELVEVGQQTQVFDLLHAPLAAYEQKTGHAMPPALRSPPELKGHSVEESLKLARFPRLTQKFWKRCP
jgi:hypothetical protein